RNMVDFLFIAASIVLSFIMQRYTTLISLTNISNKRLANRTTNPQNIAKETAQFVRLRNIA
ncbi:MAG: hypothetical protein K2H84_05805, partial [Paramuribaculum sp.]|nr:hypothetical protein [Paramuribaculum sp.]